MGPLKNAYLLAGTLVSVVMLVLVLYLLPLQRLFHTESLGGEWLFVALLACGPLRAIEAAKSVGLSPRYPLDGFGQGLAPCLLKQVAGCPRHDRTEQSLVVGVGCEHYHLGLRVGLADLPAGLDAVAVGQADIP